MGHCGRQTSEHHVARPLQYCNKVRIQIMVKAHRPFGVIRREDFKEQVAPQLT